MTNPEKPADQTRTDDLLAGGTEQKDGAKGFETKPEQLQTGMENMPRQSGAGGGAQARDRK